MGDAAADALSRALGIPALWARVLRAWGVTSEDAYLGLVGPGELSAPERLPDLGRAAALLASAARTGQRIRVHGDYDADGVTATAVLVRVLLRLGASVDWWIPNRFDDGYGLHPEAVQQARADGIELLVTVDCGSSSAAAAVEARTAGVGLIITDHHRIPAVWPQAEAFVNPERLDADRPILSGAGVALQLARALLGEDPPAACWALAALGAVADVMPMQGDTRVIVRRGLRAIETGEPVGLVALQRAARRDPAHVTARDLAFGLAPRLNAAGRLGSPVPALRLALTDRASEAERLAAELEELNRRRRSLADDVIGRAEALIARREVPLPPFLVVAGEGWHEGVLGIAAGRLSDRLERPVAVVAVNPDGIRGSARGGRYGDVLKAFEPYRERFAALGGHRGAAGFTLHPWGLAGLEAALSESFVREVDPTANFPVVDAAPHELNPALGEFLESLEPFGPGLALPRFRVAGEIEMGRRMGDGGRHARFRLREALVEGVGFGYGSALDQMAGRRVDALWTVESNWWRGRRTFELRLQHVLWPPLGSGALGRHAWTVGRPPSQSALLLVAASQRRARQAIAALALKDVRTVVWWQAPPREALWTERPRLGLPEAAYIIDGPPHRWALEALLASLPEAMAVHWDPDALKPDDVLRRWARLVPDPDRLRRLWRAIRAERSPLMPGRRVLGDLGLDRGERPDRRRELEESVHFRTAWFERRAAEADWARGGPWVWREEDEARGLAE